MAVLPFADRSGSTAAGAPQGYLALGFAEEVVRALARFRSLRVIAAQSSFALAQAGTDPRELGSRLGARYCLAGSSRTVAAAPGRSAPTNAIMAFASLKARVPGVEVHQMAHLQGERVARIRDSDILQHIEARRGDRNTGFTDVSPR